MMDSLLENDEIPAKGDEESQSANSNFDEPSQDDVLGKKYRAYRKWLVSEYSFWGKLRTFIMYFMYMHVVVLAVVMDNGIVGNKTIYILGMTGYSIWFVVVVFGGLPYLILGGRQNHAWGGTPATLGIALALLNLLLFLQIALAHEYEYDYSRMNYVLLETMAVTVFVDQKVLDPAYYQLFLFYQGAISADELGECQPVTNVSNEVLLRVAGNAGKAVGVSEDVILLIKNTLAGQRIRKDREEALDDWALILNKLGNIVSLIPFVSKSKLTTLQYRNISRQILVYLRSYIEKGKISTDEVNNNRSVPLSTFESLRLMFTLSWGVKWLFLSALTPRVINAALEPVAGPFNKMFLEGGMEGDQKKAAMGLAGFLSLLFVIKPLLNLWSNVVVSSYVANLSDKSRRKMLSVVLRGGTEFGDNNPAGQLNDAFSNQIKQLEIFTLTWFVGMIPMLVQITMSVVVAAAIYPFASVLFISMIPIVLSIDKFTDAATEASLKQVRSDGKLVGKFNSVVECRPAIRACNSSSWVESEMNDMLSTTRDDHRTVYFRSGFVANVFQAYTSIYSLLLYVPLGILVLNGTVSVGAFFGLMPPVKKMVGALAFVGKIQSQVSLYSGSLQVIKRLMDETLFEEPPSKSKDAKQNIALSPLSQGLRVENVAFRYNEKLPNILNNININIEKGTYIVLCGGSGSGKSTVLNLLMRFRKPNEGAIYWDDIDIYKTNLDSFREQVGVMFQKTMIYHATIRDNILFGMPERPGDIEKAAQGAEIAETIRSLPDGYDTVIGGDAAGGMSGGQLQRICLARALYRQPSVLLLDEATSALDAVSEQAIFGTLINLRKYEGLTLISVSHHPSTAVDADKIVVLNHGVIAEEGSYNELISREGGIFKGLVDAGASDEK